MWSRRGGAGASLSRLTMQISLEHSGRRWRVDQRQPYDLSIPINFEGAQPSFYDAPAAAARPFTTGDFSGDVRTGASCNCATYTLTPHCNGTHTESAGHLLTRALSVHGLAHDALLIARLITVPVVLASDVSGERDEFTEDNDLLITRAALAAHIQVGDAPALIVRTLPNSRAKRTQRYRAHPAAFFARTAMEWIVAREVQHLIVDVPSLDRADDGGRLTCHRVFWGMAARGSDDSRIDRPHATVTELAYIDDGIGDGLYALSLQIAPFVADAAPSRPLLYPLVPA